MKSEYRFILHIVLVLIISSTAAPAFSQPPNPGSGPIGGGLIFLLLSGLILGVLKLNKKNRK
jgi:hypothetical protein